MEKIVSGTINKWRQEGSETISENFKVFQNLVQKSKYYVQRGNYKAAAAYGEMAAFYANGMHGGFFVSHELEQVLHSIAQRTIHERCYPKKNMASLSDRTQQILHVTTTLSSIGGHSRMLWRWIQQDNKRTHSIAITRQESQTQVPEVLNTTVKKSGGKTYVINKRIGSLISWAKNLRKIANKADLIVLHIHNYDIIPLLAFSQKENLPPIIFLDHSDHKFWLGVIIGDLFVSLRESGKRLLKNRRGVEGDRSVLLPIIIEPTQRTLSRSEAKQKLGIPADSILLLSVARAIKYKTFEGLSFADSHVQILEQNEKVILIVVGPDQIDDWAIAILRTSGRIRVINETPNTAVFYQAADIYVDSFPFVSNTSLLEAGNYAIPLVTRYSYSEESEILGADMPGLIGNLIKTRNIEEYNEVLSHLVRDENFRLSIGEATRKKIIETHLGNKWQHNLENIYMRAFNMPITYKNNATKDQMSTTELDCLLPIVQGGNLDVDSVMHHYMRVLPISLRWHHWKRFSQNFKYYYPLGLLSPEWLYIYYVRLKLIFKRFIK